MLSDERIAEILWSHNIKGLTQMLLPAIRQALKEERVMIADRWFDLDVKVPEQQIRVMFVTTNRFIFTGNRQKFTVYSDDGQDMTAEVTHWAYLPRPPQLRNMEEK